MNNKSIRYAKRKQWQEKKSTGLSASANKEAVEMWKTSTEERRNARWRKHSRGYAERQHYGHFVGVALAVLLAVLMIWVATDITNEHAYSRYDNSEGVARTFMNYIRELSNVEDLNFKTMAQTIQERIPGEENWFSNTLTAIMMPGYVIGKFIVYFAKVITVTFRYLF